ncbi:MAG TPA: hypothetical protein VK081_08045, partial [Planctomycetota bacterium]|nr:hypothetical protein [Planctomycetota bacterium]
ACGANLTLARFASGGFHWSGEGCPGSVGPTTLRAQALPQVGQTFAVEALPQPSAAHLLVGFSNLGSPFGPLPLDLTFLGMPDCPLRVSSEIVVPFQGSPLRASVPLPPDPALAGGRLHVQALVLDPGANALGAVLSESATAVIGG